MGLSLMFLKVEAFEKSVSMVVLYKKNCLLLYYFQKV